MQFLLITTRLPLRQRYTVSMNGIARGFVLTGAVAAFIGVALGAFGAHALRETLHLDARWMAVWETGVQYHLTHALALLFVGLSADRFTRSPSLMAWAGRLFTAGIVIFGGSLYAMALTSLSASGPVTKLGAITPLGGVCFLTGWALLAVAAAREKTGTTPPA
jgi:uncharacterized membrane protein YgdD (TMEM256/DUF423 family)